MPSVDRWLIPGEAAGLPCAGPAELAAGLAADGLLPVTPDHGEHVQPGFLVAAACGWLSQPGGQSFGWHMWRLDSNGFWSHKPDDESVSYLLDGSAPIRDPRDDLGEFTRFLGFYCVTPEVRAGLAAASAAHPG